MSLVGLCIALLCFICFALGRGTLGSVSTIRYDIMINDEILDSAGSQQSVVIADKTGTSYRNLLTVPEF